MPQYLKPYIVTMLASIQRVEESILAIDAGQTSGERIARRSVYRNSQGWNKRDSRFGGSLASQLRNKGNGCLSSKQLKCARSMLPKYWRQLQVVAADWDAAKRQANVQRTAKQLQDLHGATPARQPDGSVMVDSAGNVKGYGTKPGTKTCGFCGASGLDFDSKFCGMCGKPVGNESSPKLSVIETREAKAGDSVLSYGVSSDCIVVPDYLLRKYSKRRMSQEIAKLSDVQLGKWMLFEANLLRRKDNGWRVFWDGRGDSTPRNVVNWASQN